jgi:hypothetical protein
VSLGSNQAHEKRGDRLGTPRFFIGNNSCWPIGLIDPRFARQSLLTINMKKATKRVLGGIALAAGAVGAIGALMIRNNGARRKRRGKRDANIWARPGMEVVFRAELMPGRNGSERTFRVQQLLPSGRVVLENFAGEHVEKEFEPAR